MQMARRGGTDSKLRGYKKGFDEDVRMMAVQNVSKQAFFNIFILYSCSTK
jgi:hypothetical protein